MRRFPKTFKAKSFAPKTLAIVTVAALAVIVPVAAQPGANEKSAQETTRLLGVAFSSVAKKVSPSVVSISTEMAAQHQQLQGFGQFFGQPGGGI